MDRFTEGANEVLQLAGETALAWGHEYIGTEHLFTALVKEGKGVAAQALQAVGLSPENVEKTALTLVGRGGGNPSGRLYLTPRSKYILDTARQVAVQLGHNYVGTEHILLAILAEQGSVARAIMKSLGVHPDDVVDAMNKIMGGIQSGQDMAGMSGSSGLGAPGRGGANGQNDLGAMADAAQDLNALAKQGKIDPVIGRDTEITRVIQILSRRTKNNPVLIGEPGVGKTAIAEGLAMRIVEGNVPEILKDKRIISLNLSSLVAGTQYRGQFEEKLKKVIEEVQKDENMILFIDELHTLIGAGGTEGGMDAANILKPSLARGAFQVIGATTLDEYKKHIEKDAALERRFQTVLIGEPSEEDALAILEGLRDRYEAFHKVKITDEALAAAVQLSARYISDRFLPDKAIDVMDEAASKVRLKSFTASPDVKDMEKKLEQIRQEKEAAVTAQNYERAAALRDEEKELADKLASLTEPSHINDEEKLVVGEEEIAEVVSDWTKIPVAKLTQAESAKLLNLEDNLHKRVIGQAAAVTSVAKAIRRARAGLKDPKRPIGSFLFLGPTGVGKTELARSLASDLFGDESAMIRLDMSEYMEKHAVSRLVGAPPGYVGYDEGGQLTDAVRRKPYCVILLDEVEKAHPDFFNMLLQVLDDGRLTDNQGRTVDFRNTVIIMTSNLGAKHLKGDTAAMGFLANKGKDEEKAADQAETAKEAVLDEVKRHFRPEFLNRIDDIIVFDALTTEDLRKIVDILLDELAHRLSGRHITLKLSDEAKDLIVAEGTDFAYGARPLKRAIQRLVEDPISELLLSNSDTEGSAVVGEAKDGKIAFSLA